MFKLTILGVSIALAVAGAQATPSIELTPSTGSGSVLVGQTFDLLVQGLSFVTTSTGGSIVNISGGTLGFTYSAGLLEVLSVTVDPRWTFGVNAGVVNNAAGTLTGVKFGTFPATLDDNFNIATIHLKAVGAGAANFALVSDPIAGKVGLSAGQTILTTMGHANIAVTAPVSPVPEPEHWAMLLIGLGIVRAATRKR